MSRAVVVLSGGLDSSTLLHYVATLHDKEVYAISFDYGQKHRKELNYAIAQAGLVGAEHEVVDLRSITKLLGNSSLVSDKEVPEGHYAEDNMKSTVVPNRNMVMASIAASWAISIEATCMYLGAHAGDHFIYPDCRPRFFSVLNASIVVGNSGFGLIPEQLEGTVLTKFVRTPFINASKNDVARLAFELNVPIELTWSCYKGGDIHCGKCGTCVERQEAIASTGHEDPTAYEDPNYWLSTLKGAH